MEYTFHITKDREYLIMIEIKRIGLRRTCGTKVCPMDRYPVCSSIEKNHRCLRECMKRFGNHYSNAK